MHLRFHLPTLAGQDALAWFRSSRAVLRWASGLAGFVVCCWLMMGIFAPHAAAEAILENNVLLYDPLLDEFFADDPFTTEIEGIQTLGNSINENQGMQQTNFEGGPDLMGTATTADDRNRNFDVYVGITHSGTLIINGGTELRDMHLVIGDIGELPNGQPRTGTGTVRIENPGSLYNNDPFFLPFPFNLTGMSPSWIPRPDDVGYDAYVGRSGSGELAISLGGVAEIQDAVIVGDRNGSSGTLTIDGIGSFLGSGGFEFMAGDDDPHNMFIGRLGSGTMQITNGGRSYNLGPQMMGTAGQPVFGAVIGASFEADTQAPPVLGGIGLVEVDGLGSTWTVGGSLQVSGFHDACEGGAAMCDPGEDDLEGDDVSYVGNTGKGTLIVRNGALVSIVTPPLDINATTVPSKLDLVIGIEGLVQLDGGRIELLGAFPVDPQQPTEIPVQRLERGRVINDGVISGDGSITTLQFRNRLLGEVIVDAGQHLSITALGDFDPMATPPDEYPGSNYGLIRVVGTDQARAEFEFQRPLADPDPDVDEQPFLNLPVPVNPMDPEVVRGRIHAQDAILRFRPEILNFGDVFFTGGTNIVAGEFDNATDGLVLVSGDRTTVTFEDEFTNGGRFEIMPNVSQVTVGESFEMGGDGSLSMAVGGQPISQSVSHLSAVGDILLDGLLEISLFATSTPFSPQPGDTFEIMRAGGELIGDFAAIILPFVSPDVGLFAFPDYALDAYFVTTFAAMPGSGSADLNGDGMVDDTDLAIWRQNLGNPGGLGDINGDGIVDGRDYFIWLMQATAPGAGALAGAAAGGALGGAVPEPGSLALLAVGGLLALAPRRRRSAITRVPGHYRQAI